MKKIVFFGGKFIGYKCAELLCNLVAEADLKLIVTNDSDLYGGSDRWYPCMMELAQKYETRYKATDDSLECYDLIKELEPDIIFVAYYDQILPSKIFNLAKEGAINLHLADAEKYRGCNAMNYAIINGDKEYGVTLHYIDSGIDSGDIIEKRLFDIDNKMTVKDLYFKAVQIGFEVFKDNISNILNSNVKTYKQNSEKAILYKRNELPSHDISSEIDKKLYDRIRAMIFKPFPAPHFYIGDKKFEIKEI